MLTDHGNNPTDVLPKTEQARAVRIAQAGRWESPGNFDAWRALASVLASDASGNVPADLVDNPGGIIARMLQAQALDLPIWTAVQDLFTITSKKTGKAKVGMSASLVRGLLLRAGHRYDVVEATDQQCVMTLERADRPGQVHTSVWTLAEAQIAGLVGHNHNWQHYPADMLFARCSTRLGRRYAPDVLHGMGYTREELVSALQEDFYPGDDAEASARVADLVERAAAATDKEELNAIAGEGQRDKLMNVYTDQTSAGGAVLPLRSYLYQCWREVEAAERDATDPEDEAVAEAGGDPEVPATDEDPVSACGCKMVEVVANGGHRSGCPRHVRIDTDTDEERM